MPQTWGTYPNVPKNQGWPSPFSTVPPAGTPAPTQQATTPAWGQRTSNPAGGLIPNNLPAWGQQPGAQYFGAGKTAPGSVGNNWAGVAAMGPENRPQDPIIQFNSKPIETGWATTTPAATPVQGPADPMGYMGGGAPSYGINPMTGQPMTSPVIDYTKQALEWTQQNPAPTWNDPAYAGGYDPGAFQTQYATLENLQPYMNPYLDDIIASGNKAIESSAAAKGLLGSTRTLGEIGDWTTRAKQQAYTDALGAFTGDRNYMTDAYRDSRDFGYKNYGDTNAWNYGLFKDEKADYDQRMKDWYNQLNGITQTGIDATGNSGNIMMNLAQAIAGLYGEGGNAQAAGIMNQSAQNRGLLGSIFGMLLG